MRLGELFDRAGLRCPDEHKNIEITEVVTDSRKATEGCIFVCIEGHNTNGHDHINEAVKNGAVVIVAEQVRDGCVGGAAIVEIDNTRRAAALLYNAQCDDPSKKLKIVGVTGTNGKTSVCFMLESIFLAAGIPCAVIGTLGCRILGCNTRLCRGGLTTPDASELYPLLAHLRDEGIEYVFMEVSSHSLVLSRVEGVTFECGVFTNLTRDHLDFHKSLEEYFLAKASLFKKCKRGFVNVDDAFGKRLLTMYRGIFACSQKNGDATATEIECNLEGTGYTLGYKDKKYRIDVGALGDFTVMNYLEAAAVALELGISAEHVCGGLSRFFGVAGRMQRVIHSHGHFEVIIDYAHTPDALERTLLNARALRQRSGRIIALFGCGGDRDRGKRKQMGQIASRLADFTVITTDNPRSEPPEAIISDILKGIDKEKPHKVLISRRKAIEYALGIAREGDILLLCGKGHEKYQMTAEGKQPFDEEAIVREYKKGGLPL